MAETIVKYNAGGTASLETGNDVDWTNPSYAWDDNDSNNATISLTNGDASYLLWGTGNDNVLVAPNISKVEIGVKGSYTGNGLYYAATLVYYDGTPEGVDGWAAYLTGSEATHWHDITNWDGAPGTWLWSDIDTLDLILFDVASGGASTLTINQLYIRVTHDGATTSSSTSTSTSTSTVSTSSSTASTSSTSSSTSTSVPGATTHSTTSSSSTTSSTASTASTTSSTSSTASTTSTHSTTSSTSSTASTTSSSSTTATFPPYGVEVYDSGGTLTMRQSDELSRLLHAFTAAAGASGTETATDIFKHWPRFEAWHNHTEEDLYWQEHTNADWDGDSWNQDPNNMVIEVDDGVWSWNENWRPTHIKITGTTIAGTCTLSDAAGGGNVIWSQANPVSGQSYALDWVTNSPGDMVRLNCYGFSSITAIQFLGWSAVTPELRYIAAPSEAAKIPHNISVSRSGDDLRISYSAQTVTVYGYTMPSSATRIYVFSFT